MNSSLDNFFSSPIWKCKLNYKNKKELVTEIEKNYKITPKKIPVNWICDLHTTFFYSKEDTSFQEYIDKSKIPSYLYESILNKVEEFFSEINLKEKNNYTIFNMWYNCYGKNQYQEIHDHGDSVFSGIYFLKFNPLEHSQTIFYNPGFNIRFEKAPDNPIFKQTINCEEDDILIFPSNIKHEVKPQKSESLRITIAFNIKNANLSLEKNKIPFKFTML